MRTILAVISLAMVQMPAPCQLTATTGVYPRDTSSAFTAIRRLRQKEIQNQLSPAERKELALAYHSVGQHLLFRRQIEILIDTQPSDPEPPFLMGRHYASDVGDLAKALQYFQAAWQRKKEPQVLAHLASAEELTGDKAAAHKHYAELRQTLPCHPLVLAGLARLENPPSQVIAACNPEDPTVLGELARLLTAEGNLAAAAGALEKAQRAAPTEASWSYRLHRLYLNMQSPAKAKEALERYQRIKAVYGGS